MIESYITINGKKSPILVKGDLAAVAQKAGVEYDNLKETFEKYQEYAKNGADPEFGRDAKFLQGTPST